MASHTESCDKGQWWWTGPGHQVSLNSLFNHPQLIDVQSLLNEGDDWQLYRAECKLLDFLGALTFSPWDIHKCMVCEFPVCVVMNKKWHVWCWEVLGNAPEISKVWITGKVGTNGTFGEWVIFRCKKKGVDSKQGNLRNKISGTKMNINSRQEGKKNAKIGWFSTKSTWKKKIWGSLKSAKNLYLLRRQQ